MNITVYCGANYGNDEVFREETTDLGNWIAENGYTLVYGGSQVGLMRVVADTVLENGGKVIGVMPKFLTEREPAHPGLTELVYVEDMSDRKRKMAELGDVFIALPGGPGTLEEITEVISWARIGKNDGPCILYNEKQYYDPLKQMYQNMVAEGFFTQEDMDKILFSNDLEEIERFIAAYQPPHVRGYDHT